MRAFKEMLGIEIWINPLFGKLKEFESTEKKDACLRDFRFMAKKGMLVFGKTNIMLEHNNHYHAVAFPSLKLRIDNLPERISRIPLETRLDIDFSLISLLEINTD